MPIMRSWMTAPLFLVLAACGAGSPTDTTPPPAPAPLYITAGQSNMTLAFALSVPEQFAVHMRAAGRDVELANVALGGTALDCWQVGADCFQRKTAALRGRTVAGVLWWQGENDAWDCSGALAATYAERLRKMVTDWRTYFGQSDLPFYVVELETFGDFSGETFDKSCDGIGSAETWETVRAAQRAVADTVPGVFLIRSTDITFGDVMHPVYAYDEIARRIAARITAP